MRQPESELQSIRDAGLYRELRPFAGDLGTVVHDASGRTLVSFASNDYLGLATCSALRETMAKAAHDYGSGSGASRLICGSHSAHRYLEERIAEFKSTPAALSFSSGFAAALGALTALAQRGDTIILDKLCHASLVDGARLSGATIRVFPHNNLEKLERLLRSTREKASAESRIIVVTESVFSMDGDRAALEEIVALKDRFGALLFLDEAHAFGVIGEMGGRGLADELGLAHRVEVQLGTLSKAAGVSGGFIASDRATIDLLINRARSFIYTTAPPPAVASTAAHAVDILGSDDGDKRRARLWTNIRQFCKLTGSKTKPLSAILPHVIGDEIAAMEFAASLNKLGFLVPAVRFPTVAKGSARLRITLSADHLPEQIAALAALLSPG